jgi:hypothetical protein
MKRRSWLKRCIIAIAVIAAGGVVVFLVNSTPPTPIVIATHLGGDCFSLTNLTSDPLTAVLNIETNRSGEWIIVKTARYALSPHEEFQSHVTSVTDSMPSRPWRLRGYATRPAHGLSAFLARLKLYAKHRNHLVGGRRINPLDTNLFVSATGPDFYAYPVTSSE